MIQEESNGNRDHAEQAMRDVALSHSFINEWLTSVWSLAAADPRLPDDIFDRGIEASQVAGTKRWLDGQGGEEEALNPKP